MKKLLIVKAGTTYSNTRQRFGDFDRWTALPMQLPDQAIQVMDVQREVNLTNLDAYAGIVVTGSHAMVSDHEAWSETLAAAIPEIVDREIPFLGICYGHQLLAYAMGGEVDYHPNGPEVGTAPIALNERGHADLLLGSLPSPFDAFVTHYQSVLQLPADAMLLAGNHFEPHHAFRIGKNAWGIQFHPEFTLSIMLDYIENQSQTLESYGFVIEQLKNNLRVTTHAQSLLKRFADIAYSPNE